jgi:hypothetical protein
MPKRVERRLRLEDAKSDLAALFEELGDRPSRRLLELAVDVDEAAAEQVRDLDRKRRLARAHEADQRDVLV